MNNEKEQGMKGRTPFTQKPPQNETERPVKTAKMAATVRRIPLNGSFSWLMSHEAS